jgi:hypothetical protein
MPAAKMPVKPSESSAAAVARGQMLPLETKLLGKFGGFAPGEFQMATAARRW